MKPRCSSSGYLRQTARLKLSWTGVQWYWPFIAVPNGTGWPNKVHFGWSTWRAWHSEHPYSAVQYSSSVTFGHAIHHSVFSAKGEMNESMTLQTLKCDRGMHWLNLPNATDGGGKKNTHGSLVMVEHVCNPLCTNFSFPPAVGEDTVNTCWRDSDFCNNCLAWNTTRTFKDEFHFFHVAFILRRCRCSTARGIVCLFRGIHNDIRPPAKSFTWSSKCSWTFLQRLVTL